MVRYTLTYQPYGKDGILINWPQDISPEILASILQFKKFAEKELSKQVIYINNAYCSLLIRYDLNKNTYLSFKRLLIELSKQTIKVTNHTSRNWKIPVCYDEQFGIDLEALSQENSISIDEIIQEHSDKKYLVYFIGFLPGFVYLGGLDTSLHMPRRANPRTHVPKGAVAIGGSQTGIYPQESPGGWHIIGNTPINMFDSTRDVPCFASAGDTISFQPIELAEYEHILNQVQANNFKLKPSEDD